MPDLTLLTQKFLLNDQRIVCYFELMTIDEIKTEIEDLSPERLSELIAYAFTIKNQRTPEASATLRRRMDDSDSANWLTPDEFEARLD